MGFVSYLLSVNNFSLTFAETNQFQIIAGLDPITKQVYICSMDLIGCKTEPKDFVAAGTCEEQLLGEH